MRLYVFAHMHMTSWLCINVHVHPPHISFHYYSWKHLPVDILTPYTTLNFAVLDVMESHLFFQRPRKTGGGSPRQVLRHNASVTASRKSKSKSFRSSFSLIRRWGSCKLYRRSSEPWWRHIGRIMLLFRKHYYGK